MLTPGFATDAIGLLLLFPLTRIMLRSFLSRRFVKKLKTGQAFLWGSKNNAGQQVVDVEWDVSDLNDRNEKELEE